MNISTRESRKLRPRTRVFCWKSNWLGKPLKQIIELNLEEIHRDLQRAEFKRIGDLIKQRNKLFHSEAQPFLHRFDTGELSYAETSALMDLLKQRLDEENSDLFTPYVSALESLQDSVDLEHLATFGMEELNDLRVELDRLE